MKKSWILLIIIIAAFILGGAWVILKGATNQGGVAPAVLQESQEVQGSPSLFNETDAFPAVRPPPPPPPPAQ